MADDRELEKVQAELREAIDLLEELEWGANIGQNAYGCGICNADAYHRRGGDHVADCKLAVFLRKVSFAS